MNRPQNKNKKVRTHNNILQEKLDSSSSSTARLRGCEDDEKRDGLTYFMGLREYWLYSFLKSSDGGGSSSSGTKGKRLDDD